MARPLGPSEKRNIVLTVRLPLSPLLFPEFCVHVVHLFNVLAGTPYSLNVPLALVTLCLIIIAPLYLFYATSIRTPGDLSLLCPSFLLSSSVFSFLPLLHLRERAFVFVRVIDNYRVNGPLRRVDLFRLLFWYLIEFSARDNSTDKI